MRKMKLELDRLTVESFEMVAGATDPRGTIQGNAASPPTPACSGPCSFFQSCLATCGISCTCIESCNTNIYLCC